MDDVNVRVRRRLERIEPSDGAFERTLGLVRRRQQRRRVGAGVVGVLLTAVVAFGLWSSLGGERGKPGTTPTPGVTQRPSPELTRSPSPDATPTGTNLVLAGDGEAWVVDVDAGTARQVTMPELSAGDPPFRVVRRGDRLVAWGYDTALVLDRELAAPPAVLADDSWIFIPSALDDRVWIGVLDEEAPGTGRPLSSVREITVDGKVTVADTAPPDGLWPIAAVGKYLVFQVSEPSEPSDLSVWDPQTGAEIERLPEEFPLAWQGDALAACEGDCQAVRIVDYETGRRPTIVRPAGTFGFDAYQGAFSPDGATLALSLRIDSGPDSRRALALIDVASGELDVVNGTNVEAGYNFVAWSPSGDAVFISGGSRSRQIVEYRPAEGNARTLPVEVTNFYGMAAV